MTQKAKPEASQPDSSPLKWALILGMALLFFIVIGIISSRSIHVVMTKQSRSSESIQDARSQAHR